MSVVHALARLLDASYLDGPPTDSQREVWRDAVAAARFFDDAMMRAKGWPIAWFLRNPAQWSGRAGARGGHAAPRKAAEYERRSVTFDELMQEREAALGGGDHG